MRAASAGETEDLLEACSMVAGSPPRAAAIACELAVLDRDALARRELLQLVQRAEVRGESRVLLVAAELATVSPMLVGVGGEHELLRGVVGTSSVTSTPLDPARTQRSLSGIGILPRS